FVKENGEWKVWRYAPAAEDLADRLVKASSKAERAGLVGEEKELGTGGLRRGLLTQARGVNRQRNYKRAVEIYELAVDIAEQLGERNVAASALLSLGAVYRSLGDRPRELEQYQKSLTISEEIGDKAGIANALNNIGVVYQLQGKFTKALELYQKSLKIKEEIGDKAGIADELSNIGIVLGTQGKYAEALELYQKSLGIFEEIGDKVGISRTL